MKIKTKKELIQCMNRQGFLPFFTCDVKGISIEEQIHESVWFDSSDGAWEWKGPIIQESKCAYGKFFLKKAGYITKEMYQDFLNYRRDGYDFDARYNDGLSNYKDKKVIDTLEKLGPSLSFRLKEESAIQGFETVITRLQMQGYVIVSNFEYKIGKNGKPYGWGIARYATPEQFYGEDYVLEAYKKDPKDSYNRLKEHLLKLYPNQEKEIEHILK